MKSLKDIIEQHTLSELSDMIFKDLAVYHTHKLTKAIQQADKRINDFDYEEKTKPKEIDATHFTVGHVPSEKTSNRVSHQGVPEILFNKIKEAKKIVQKEINTWHELGYTLTFGVDPVERTVEVIIVPEDNPLIVYTKGKAFCNQSDIFNEYIGKMIALYKANYPDEWKDKLYSIGFGYLFEK